MVSSPLFSLLAALGGCDADCEDPGRINGDYAVFHDVLNVQGSSGNSGGDDSGGGSGGDSGDTATASAKGAGGNAVVDGYDGLSYSAPINGWTQWDMTWSPSTNKLAITASDAKEVMGDPGDALTTTFAWNGTLTPSEDNCNAFAMTVNGAWVTSQATTHNFNYKADLLWTGEGLSGTYTYSDSYVIGDNPNPSGGITNATGEAVFVLQTDGKFDTGFFE
jgi:hypothetical protein